jgi:uncharacterized membrane protein YhaH (DUF805 family)
MRHLFLNLDGRISRKTFWLASLGVLVTGFVVAAIAPVIAEKLAVRGRSRRGSGGRRAPISASVFHARS